MALGCRALAQEGATATPLALHPDNPHYFLFRGKPVILLTSGEHYGAVLNRAFDYRPYLDELKAHGFNLTRTFSGTYREVPGSFNIENNTLAPAHKDYLAPWARSQKPGASDGLNKFDLTRWDPAYFARLRDFVRQAGRRGIVVEMVLFCTLYNDDLWKVSPMNAINNVNDIGKVARREVFTLKEGALTAAQEAAARKIVSDLGEFDNVYFEVCNEPYFEGVTQAWQDRIIAAIVDAEKDRRHRHLIAQNIANGSKKVDGANSAVSIFNFHYATPPDTVGQNYHLNKAVGDDETGFRGTGDLPYRQEAWDFLIAGGAVFSNLDYSFNVLNPDGSFKVKTSPGGGGPEIRRQLAGLKRFVEGFDFVKMRPANSLLRRVAIRPRPTPAGAKPGPAPTARVLAEVGSQYAVYLRGGVAAEFVLDLPPGRYLAEWVYPAAGKVVPTPAFEHKGGGRAFSIAEYTDDIAVKIARHKDNPPGPAGRPLAKAAMPALLQQKCVRCHSGKAPKGELDLTSLERAWKGGESGPVLVAGKPGESLLYEKVHQGAMPPGKRDRLTPAEVESVRHWIAGLQKPGRRPGGKGTGATAETVTQHDVIPILLRRCTVCHGLRRKEGGLDLRSRESMVRGGKSGPAIIPGDAEESRLIQKIRNGEMPPRKRLVEVSVQPIEQAETEVLARWIGAGAPEVSIKPDVATRTPDRLVTDKDRDFWAFRAPKPVAVPAVQNAVLIRNPIDAFVARKLEQKGLAPAPESDRLTLLRRAYHDLTGLPPEPEEVQAFLADSSPDAYERLIDRLLASPRYGERWGRYWLDLAGYADSEGKREQDLSRPHAWRYRDYVIRSFNADKGYDRFLLEQIAGDELADYEHAPEITQEIYDNLVATGFLRMAPDATWANITGFIPDRIEVIADEIDVLGSAVMGLTMKCARCHSHKFDPIPQRDYYRLAAVFKGALDEYDWLKPDVQPGLGPISHDIVGGRHLPFVTTTERQAWEQRRAALAKQEGAKQARGLPEPRIQALWDRGEPSPTYIYRRGDPLRPGRLVGPGVPSVLTDGKTPLEVKPPWPGAKQSGRRLAFARWLTQPDHPLTARVLVNRLWKHHFGTGLVKTLANFGKSGMLPSHPELLDWLALEFVRQGWSLKAMHRLMMTSATYRQNSAVTPNLERLDPDNALLSRMPMVRRDAESLYDSLLLVAGRLDAAMYGPGEQVTVRADGLVTPAGKASGWRRLVYVQQQRKRLPTHLETFDYPPMNPNCIERRDSTAATQALHLLNNRLVYRLAEHFAERVAKEVGPDEVSRLKRVYLIALSRLPNEEELQIGQAALARLVKRWDKHLGGAGSAPRAEVARRALTDFCHAIMNSADFLYVD
jgi:mono/diheme cytochrome c family protein